MPGPAVPKALGPRKARDPIAGLPSGVALVASGELLGLSVGAKLEQVIGAVWCLPNSGNTAQIHPTKQ